MITSQLYLLKNAAIFMRLMGCCCWMTSIMAQVIQVKEGVSPCMGWRHHQTDTALQWRRMIPYTGTYAYIIFFSTYSLALIHSPHARQMRMSHCMI